MGGIASPLYGVIVYLVFLATFPYVIAFVGNRGVPKTIDRAGPKSSVPRCSSTPYSSRCLPFSTVPWPGPPSNGWWTQFVRHPIGD